MTLVRLCPLDLTERQSVLLTNPAYGAHGIKVTNTIRIAISIYKTGAVARPHMHTPNASRTIISAGGRSEEHTSELQSLLRIPYAVFCLTTNIIQHNHPNHII